MTQEEKQLLLVDLCGRLPYGVIVNIKGFDFDFKDKLTQIYKSGYGCSIQVTNNMPYGIEQVKLYLLPMSSMTEEQKKTEWKETMFIEMNGILTPSWKTIDWLNAHHFDYRGLIEKGLAIDCTNLNIY